MRELIQISAKIKLFKGANATQTPFITGYRPLFNFKNANTKISGRIELVDRSTFAPGDTGIVKVSFVMGIIDFNNY